MVHKGNVCWGGKESREHSKQEVMVGRITRAWPLNPSVPIMDVQMLSCIEIIAYKSLGIQIKASYHHQREEL